MSLAVAGGRAITNEAECLNQLMGRATPAFWFKRQGNMVV
jgi:hypothetical protein